MLLIFDCDGVLRSVSWPALYGAYQAIAKHLSIDPKSLWNGIVDFQQWFDFDWKNNLRKMGVRCEEDVPKINSIFHEVHDPCVQVFPWADAILKKLSERWTLALFSSSSSRSVRSGLGSLTRYFPIILGCEDVRKLKPDPEGVMLILQKLEEDPRQAFFIGDTGVDVLAGRNAGTKTVGVTWGLGTEEELKKYKPDLILRSSEELLHL